MSSVNAVEEETPELPLSAALPAFMNLPGENWTADPPSITRLSIVVHVFAARSSTCVRDATSELPT